MPTNSELDQRVDYFEHDADIGIIGRGPSIEQAFIAAARATFALMTDIARVAQSEEFEFEFEEPDAEFALVTWLNALLAHAQDRGLALAAFDLRKDASCWHAHAWGERWNDTLERGVDVKGASLTMLTVRQVGENWEARCVVDV